MTDASNSLESLSELCDALQGRWQNSGGLSLHHLGTAAYALPNPTPFVLHRLNSKENWALVADTVKNWTSNYFNFSETASGNVFIFGENCTCVGRHHVMGSNNLAIILGSHFGYNPTNIHFHTDEHLFYFGEDCTSNTITVETGGSPTAVTVGRDCMFSAEITLMTADQHSIVDSESGRHLNGSSSIQLEPHVWVGYQAMILKGAKIGFGSVVGARSVVTRNIPRKVAVGGNPARVIRENVGWVREQSPNAGTRDYLRRLESEAGEPSLD